MSNIRFSRTALAVGTATASILAFGAPVSALAQPANPECIAPAQPGGGFDITCQIAQAALADADILESPLRVSYMPGGIGAVAYNTIISQRRAEPGTIIAFSSGSLLNLAQGKFGDYTVEDVRWLASIATDYGAVLVREDAPYQNLTDLMEAIEADPTSIVLGAGGTIGSQDWMKAALTAQAAGIDYRDMRFVAFEGGGDCATALQGGHVQVCMNDVGDSRTAIQGGAPLRLLAVYAQERLPDDLADIPTAAEQGYDIEWPILRGFYVGPDVSDADYQWWVEAFARAMADPGYEELLASRNILPRPLTGDELNEVVVQQVELYGQRVEEFGLAPQ